MTPTPTPTPDKIVQAILTYQKVYCGPLFYLDQLVMAKFDLDSHLASSASQNTERCGRHLSHTAVNILLGIHELGQSDHPATA